MNEEDKEQIRKHLAKMIALKIGIIKELITAYNRMIYDGEDRYGALDDAEGLLIHFRE